MLARLAQAARDADIRLEITAKTGHEKLYGVRFAPNAGRRIPALQDEYASRHGGVKMSAALCTPLLGRRRGASSSSSGKRFYITLLEVGMRKTTVVVIGGGATGTGILRDLAMRGIRCLLLEQGDLASGTSSRFHGLLHSGARYAPKDPEAARECIAENAVLRRIGGYCVEDTEGYFVRTRDDDPAFEKIWAGACVACGIPIEHIPVAEARRRERNLTPDAVSVYRVPDAAVDGFRLVWHNVMSARRYGGDAMTYSRVTQIATSNGRVRGVRVLHTQTGESEDIACDFVINATGSWAGEVSRLAGIEVNVSPDRGTLLAFNHRFTERVINRLHPAGDGDIFVPHGSITILGTTSIPTDRADDTIPTSGEVLELLTLGEVLFPHLRAYRILRAFAGTRPLYSPDASTGRSATRNFVIIDHENDGLSGMVSITGGKFTSFRLMAEKTCDHVCAILGVQTPCRTAEEPIVPTPAPDLLARASRFFPPAGLDLAVARLGYDLEEAVSKAEQSPWKRLLLCECELVTLAEFELAASRSTSHSLGDIRRRTRLGMGTCQAGFCALRATGAIAENGFLPQSTPQQLLQRFLEERWHGIRPLLWGNQLREVELERGIYGATLNIDGDCDAPGCELPAPPVCPSDNGPALTPGLDALPLPPLEAPAAATVPTPGKEYDCIIVGAGFAGLIAAAAAARKGKSVLIISKGAGALAIGGGTIDLLGYLNGRPVQGDPFAAIKELPPNHPYRLLGPEVIHNALEFIKTLAAEAGQPLLEAGTHAEGNAWLPTAAGTLKPVWLTHPDMDPHPLKAAQSFAVLGISGLKDFSSQLVLAGLLSHPAMEGKQGLAAQMPNPFHPSEHGVRDGTALDMALFMDTPQGFAWLSQALSQAAGRHETVLIPAVLGTRVNANLHQRLEQATGKNILELFCPPPSVTGLRLRAIVRSSFAGQHVALVENAAVTAALTQGRQCIGLVVGDTNTVYRAKEYIIATGGLFSGGVTTGPGQAREAIFGLPVPMPARIEEWSCRRFFGRSPHPFAAMGVTVDSELRPTAPNGTVCYENVRFAGRSLAGYDFATEKSGSGVALATGWFAGSRE